MKLSALVVLSLALSIAISAQSTQFTYQGRLLDQGLPASANYDFQFALFAVDTGGAALGTLERNGVAVSDGIFTVSLDFNDQFPGANRWLEISVKPAGSAAPFTVLAGRQPIRSTPYSIRSASSSQADFASEADQAQNASTAANADNLGGIAASQYVVTTDPRMSDPRTPLPFSGSYIQNTPAQQAGSNFFISGLGRANILSANTQFNLGTNRILASSGPFNFFAGIGTGAAITSGVNNTLVGSQAGDSITEGGGNSYFGAQAGRSTVSANGNSFFGSSAGRLNTSGGLNSFFGLLAGEQNSTAGDNSFFGAFSGAANTTGTANSFFGRNSGGSNVGGNRNSFFGFESGNANVGGNLNAFFGAGSGRSNTQGFNNTFVGNDAGRSNTEGFYNTFSGASTGFSNLDGFFNSFFGNEAGYLNAGGDANTFVGYRAGAANIDGNANAFFGTSAGESSTGTRNAYFGANAGGFDASGNFNSFFGSAAGSGNNGGSNNTAVGFGTRFASTTLSNATVIGNLAQVSASDSLVLGSINGVNGATADTNVGIGISAPTDRLHVVGNSRFAGNVIVTGGLTAAFSPGTAALPGISFSGDPATGLFSSGVGNLSFSTAGVSRMAIALNGDISIGAPSALLGPTRFSVSGDVNTQLIGAVNANSAGIGGAFAGNSYGVLGAGLGMGVGQSVGVYGRTSHDSGTGFRIGVLGEITNVPSAGAGIYGRAQTAPNNWAGYFEGEVRITESLTANTLVPSGSSLTLGQADDNVNVPGTLRVGNTATPRGQINLLSTLGNANLYMQGSGGTVGINFGVGTGPGNPFFFISHYNGTTYTDRLAITSNGEVRINTLGSAGATALCRNALNEISTCSSSMRYKSNVLNYRSGRSILERLRPVSFSWKGNDSLDLGLVAEEVAEIEPLLVTYNDKGVVEGVKYDRIGVVLVNVVKEQQAKIDSQQKQIDELKEMVCSIKPNAKACVKQR